MIGQCEKDLGIDDKRSRIVAMGCGVWTTDMATRVSLFFRVVVLE